MFFIRASEAFGKQVFCMGLFLDTEEKQMYHICETNVSCAFMTVNRASRLRNKGVNLYHMNKKQELNVFIRECITTALLQKLETQSLEDIAITELVKEAGVSRVSFYRNFKSKQEVLEKHLVVLIEEWGRDFEEKGDPTYLSESLLIHFYKYREFYLMLYKQKLSNLIYENIRYACKLEESQNNIERYAKSMVAGTIFGWLDEWARQGMKETPQEIMKLTAPQNGQHAKDSAKP